MRICGHEPAVLDAVRRDRWEDDLQRHVGECAVCADLAVAARFLQMEEETARAETRGPLPSAGLIWWRAEMLAHRTKVERATRPIAFIEKIAYGLAAAGLAGAAMRNWSRLQEWLAPLRAAWSQMASAGMAPVLDPVLYLSAGAFLLLLMVLFALYLVWAEG